MCCLTVPPVVAPHYKSEATECQSYTVTLTTVLVMDVPLQTTTVVDKYTTVELVNSYRVTPVTVVHTFSANLQHFHDTFEVNIQ